MIFGSYHRQGFYGHFAVGRQQEATWRSSSSTWRRTRARGHPSGSSTGSRVSLSSTGASISIYQCTSCRGKPVLRACVVTELHMTNGFHQMRRTTSRRVLRLLRVRLLQQRVLDEDPSRCLFQCAPERVLARGIGRDGASRTGRERRDHWRGDIQALAQTALYVMHYQQRLLRAACNSYAYSV